MHHRLNPIVMTIACGVFLAALSPRVDAMTAYCTGFGTISFSPRHPSSADIINVQVQSWIYSGLVVPGSAVRTLSRIQLLPDNSVSIDVIVTEHPERFPPVYTTVLVPLDDSYGAIGPLPVGSYWVTASVLYGDAPDALAPIVFCPTSTTVTLSVSSQRGPTALAPVIEYYDANLDHYFVTQIATEIAALDAGQFPGWIRTGQSFLAYLPGQSDNRGHAVCRYYGLPSAGLDSHFYSASSEECFDVAGMFSGAWRLETNDVFEIPFPDRLTGSCPANTMPVYRLWNARVDSDHRYTNDPSTKQLMIANDWIPEGYGPDQVVMCAPLP